MERAQGVEHHLGIVFRFHEHTHTVFEVDNVQRLIGDNNAVAGAEALRNIAAEIQPLFDGNDGIGADLLRFRDGFQHKLYIAICVEVHFVTVVRRARLFRWHLQCTPELMLAQRMCSGAFFGSLGFPILELLLQPS